MKTQGIHRSIIKIVATNSILPEENESEWIDLFDGKSTDGWRAYNGKEIPEKWAAIDGELTFDTDLTVTSVTIFDLTGKTIKTYKQLSKHINVSALSKGVYFIQVITDKNTITRKFVKQ